MPTEYLKHALHLYMSRVCSPAAVADRLQEIHYVANDMDELKRGQFLLTHHATVTPDTPPHTLCATLEIGPSHTEDIYTLSFRILAPDDAATKDCRACENESLHTPQTYIANMTLRRRGRAQQSLNSTASVAVAAAKAATDDTPPPTLQDADGNPAKTLNEGAEEITIYPASHFVTSQDEKSRILEAIRSELGERVAELEDDGLMLEAERLAQRTESDLLQIETVGYCRGVENYARHLACRKAGEPPDCLVDYFPERDWLLIVDESHISVPQVRGMYFGDRMRKETLVRHGFRLPSALDNRPLQESEFWARVQQCVFVSATPGDWEMQQSAACLLAAKNTKNREGPFIDANVSEVTELILRPTGILDPIVEMRPSEGQVDDLLSEILTRIARGQRTLVTTLTKRTAEEVSGFLGDHGLKTAWLHSDVKALDRLRIVRDLRTGVFDVLVGVNLLREGLDLPEVSLVAIMDADKEGFLRSDKSLIQTIGRASRHINGTVILYCQTVTASMQVAQESTVRRITIIRLN